MSSRNRWGLAAALALLCAGPAPAAELRPAIRSEFGYDSNNASRTQNEDGGARLRTVPSVSLRESFGRLSFDANARVAYDNAIDFDDADDYFDQFGSLGATWEATSRTQLSLRSAFARVENLDRIYAVDSFARDEIPDTSGRRSRTTTNRSVLQLTHRLTSRWTASARANYDFRDFRESEDTDRHGYGSSLSFGYTLNARTGLNFGGRFAYDSYESTSFRRGSRTRYYQGFVGVDYLLAPDIQVGVSGGPAWVDRNTNPGSLDFRTYPFVTSFSPVPGVVLTPDDFGADPSQPYGFVLEAGGTTTCDTIEGVLYAPSTCTPARTTGGQIIPVLMTTENNPINSGQSRVAGDSSDTAGWDFFGSASVVKSWEWGDAAIAYNRRESPGANRGTSSTSDSVSLSATGYRPRPRWELGGFFVFTSRKSAGRVPQDLPALTDTTIMVNAEGIIDGPGALFAIPTAGLSNGYVTDGSRRDTDDTKSYFVKLQVDHTLTEHLESFANFSWRRDDLDQRTSDDTIDIFRVFIGLQYTFDPVLF